MPGRRNIKPAWEFSTAGVIWRLVPAEGCRLVGEERNLAEKSASFFCINGINGSPLWKGISFNEKWWIGIEAVSGDTLFLHTFATPDLPGHRGITAVALDDGRTLWSAPDLTIVDVQERHLVATRRDTVADRFVHLDARTGTVTGDPGPLDEQPSASTRARGDEALLPEPASGARSLEVSRLFPRLQDVATPIELIQLGPLVVVGWHEEARAGGRFTGSVAILDTLTGELLFTEVLSPDAPAIVPDVFFVQGDFLYYIQNRRMLGAVRLPHRAASPS